MKNVLLSFTAALVFTSVASASDSYLCSISDWNGKTQQKVIKMEEPQGCRPSIDKLCADNEPSFDKSVLDVGSAKIGRYEITLTRSRDSILGPDDRGHFVPVFAFEVKQVVLESSAADALTGLHVSNAYVSNGEGFSFSLSGVSVSCKQQ